MVPQSSPYGNGSPIAGRPRCSRRAASPCRRRTLLRQRRARDPGVCRPRVHRGGSGRHAGSASSPNAEPSGGGGHGSNSGPRAGDPCERHHRAAARSGLVATDERRALRRGPRLHATRVALVQRTTRGVARGRRRDRGHIPSWAMGRPASRCAGQRSEAWRAFTSSNRTVSSWRSCRNSGIVGLAWFLAFLVLAYRGAARAAREHRRASRSGVLSIVLIQASYDWTWSFPGLVVPALILVGAACGGGRRLVGVSAMTAVSASPSSSQAPRSLLRIWPSRQIAAAQALRPPIRGRRGRMPRTRSTGSMGRRGALSSGVHRRVCRELLPRGRRSITPLRPSQHSRGPTTTAKRSPGTAPVPLGSGRSPAAPHAPRIRSNPFSHGTVWLSRNSRAGVGCPGRTRCPCLALAHDRRAPRSGSARRREHVDEDHDARSGGTTPRGSLDQGERSRPGHRDGRRLRSAVSRLPPTAPGLRSDGGRRCRRASVSRGRSWRVSTAVGGDAAARVPARRTRRPRPRQLDLRVDESARTPERPWPTCSAKTSDSSRMSDPGFALALRFARRRQSTEKALVLEHHGLRRPGETPPRSRSTRRWSSFAAPTNTWRSAARAASVSGPNVSPAERELLLTSLRGRLSREQRVVSACRRAPASSVGQGRCRSDRRSRAAPLPITSFESAPAPRLSDQERSIPRSSASSARACGASTRMSPLSAARRRCARRCRPSHSSPASGALHQAQMPARRACAPSSPLSRTQ